MRTLIYGLMVLASIAIIAPVLNAQQTPEEVFEWIESKGDWMSSLASAWTQTPRGNRDYDVLHYDLHVTPDFETSTMAGTIDIETMSTADGLQVITLDMGDGIEADQVQCNGQDAAFSHEGELLEITLDQVYSAQEQFLISIVYHGTPARWTFHFAQHNTTAIFSTMAEPEGSREWWPCNDVPWDKATVTLTATVPDWMVVVSVGLLTDDVDNGDGTHSVTWSTNYQTATYLVAVSGTDYEIINYEYTPATSDLPMPVPVYVYPELLENSQVGFEDTVDMIDFYSRNFGEYPFLTEKYGQVLVPTGGGMEHQTITHINAQYLVNGGKPNSLIAHELAHQWWGDYITMSEWPHIWLNESFATYSDALYHEYAVGTDYLRALMKSYRDRDYDGSIYDPAYLFDSIVYTKGAFVLHMLRKTVGEDTFWSILRTYYQDSRFAYANASTAQFQEICETVSGLDLEYFFQQWIFGTKRPTVELGWDYSPADTGYSVSVDLKQVQEDLPLFNFWIDILVETETGAERQSVWVENEVETVSIAVDQRPVNVVLDPDTWLLADFVLDGDQFQFTADNKLPQALFGESYSESLGLTGGTAPYTIELYSGALPPGINLDLQTGELTGAPLEKGTYNFTVQARDSRSHPMTTRKEFRLKALSPQAECRIVPDQQEYSGGETMTVDLELTNKLETALDSVLYIVLEINGVFLFLDITQTPYPSFATDVTGIHFVMPENFTLNSPLLSIPLPAELPVLEGYWWSLILNSDTGAAAGEYSKEYFCFL